MSERLLPENRKILIYAALLALSAANGASGVSMNDHASAIEAQIKTPIMSLFHATCSIGGLSDAAAAAPRSNRPIGNGHLAIPDTVIAVAEVASTLALRDVGPRALASSSGFAVPNAGSMKLAALACPAMLVDGAVAD